MIVIQERPAAEKKLKAKRKRIFRLDKKKGALNFDLVKTSYWRLGVQIGSTILSLLLGWQFIRFVEAAKTTTSGTLPTRPPGVEGYLPISGLMGAIDWIYQGTLNNIHPAATILFLIFILMALMFRKAFCGWFCPVGFISENLARLGRFIFGRNYRIVKWLDIPLQGLKYFLLGFFVVAIFNMTPEALHQFIQSPYNKVSDVKMLEFFLNLSKTGAIVILILAALSMLYNGFWCRYLCPYGALLGLFSWLSPIKVRRDENLCVDCSLCDKACPARLPVSHKKSITSVECIGCHDCVTSCPVPGALLMGTKKSVFSPKRLAVGIVALFIIGYSAARIGGLWENELTDEEIRFHVARMHSDA